jgi:hypothetical protein
MAALSLLGGGAVHALAGPAAAIGPWIGAAVGRWGSPPVFYSGSATGCWWLVAEDHWCHDATDEDTGDISLEQGDVDLLNDAFWKLNHYIQFVVDFFEDHASAWDHQLLGCVLARIMGGGVAGPFWVAERDLGDGTRAETVPDTGFLTMSSMFMSAVRDYRDWTGNDSNNGDWNCPTAAVSGLLLHESVHACGALNELVNNLADAYFTFHYADFWGMTDTTCCQRTALSSWDEVDVTCDDLDSRARFLFQSGWTRSDLPCAAGSCW